MASYTRQQILERFTKVGRETAKIKENIDHIPCFVKESVEPEPEDKKIDFELIMKDLEEQDRKTNKEFHEKKYYKKAPKKE
jgi:hypothetical protein